MSKRLVTVRDALEDIASGEGDLTCRMDARSSDEPVQIGSAFNRFFRQISAILLKVRHASVSLKTFFSELAGGNLDLSARTEKRAGSQE